MTARDDNAPVTLSRRFGEHTVTAVISPRAAAVRSLRVDDVDLVEPTTMTTEPPGMSGAILAPWPNRVEDAAWWLDGREHRLTVTEPALGHATHGLLTTTDFVVRARRQDAVTLGAAISRPDGYPFVLDVSVSYRLCDSGIVTRIAVHNQGATRAPVALGAHPYLRIGDVPTARLRMSLDADHVWPLDERHLPVGRVPCSVTDVLVSESPRHATYESSAPGRTLAHTLTAPDGRCVVLTADGAHRFTQLWITDALAGDDGPREAIAIEPMTAPPNALRSGVGLHWLDAGARWTTTWNIRLSRTGPDADAGCGRQPEASRVR
ncbi:aldose epimerase [Myceligenerans pegani]|uniref:Aldose epimerase n=1 Tax=Myceligenerans pegani TaxID=2776917 RepID=A0ABR9MWD9_9MICO|nr:aldose epimerase [Myceligenerans sp. TRM 65318]MBE1875366.1 aldose epimerase [Myceligenerans sp. TRM 65318]MBE3017637.1 aldose epimerase [Myceligenerans sp. TRM 65318]